ncbi:MAG TPA: zinc-ribbon domain-containing protein [Pyrinomonadaceae bacterium]
MQPEISRRCLVCGASVRAGAQFCSQCGRRLGERGGAGAESSDVRPDARAGEAPSADAAGGGEVERAFETWRSAEHVAAEEARRTRVAEPAAGDDVRPATADDSARPAAAGGNARAPVAGVAEPPPPTREAVVPETRALEPPPPRDEGATGARLAGAVGATRKRAASVVKDAITPRVERVRDRSIVMLEEAPDDSGLRFVLIAAALFALFIFLLVLNTVIK